MRPVPAKIIQPEIFLVAEGEGQEKGEVEEEKVAQEHDDFFKSRQHIFISLIL